MSNYEYGMIVDFNGSTPKELTPRNNNVIDILVNGESIVDNNIANITMPDFSGETISSSKVYVDSISNNLDNYVEDVIPMLLNEKANVTDIANISSGLINMGVVANVSNLSSISSPMDGYAYIVTNSKDSDGNSYIYRYTVIKDNGGNIVSQGWNNTYLTTFNSSIVGMYNTYKNGGLLKVFRYGSSSSSSTDFSSIIYLHTNQEYSTLFPYGIGLNYIRNGNAAYTACIYLSSVGSDGKTTLYTNGLVASYVSPNKETKTNIETITLTPAKIGYPTFTMKVNWSKLIYNTNFEYDLILDNNIVSPQKTLKSYNSINKPIKYDLLDKGDDPVFIITNHGTYGVKNLQSDIVFTKGTYWYKNQTTQAISKLSSGNWSTSQNITLNPSDKTILVSGVAGSVGIGHVFLNSSDVPISLFGDNSSINNSDPETLEITIPSGATKVSFTWTNINGKYQDSFYCTRGGEYLTNYSGLTWTSGKWVVSSQSLQLGYVSSNLYDVSRYRALKLSLDPTLNSGTAFFDENNNFLKILPGKILSGTTWTDVLGTVKVPKGAKYASFTWRTEYTNNFNVWSSDYDDFTIDYDGIYIATKNKLPINNDIFNIQTIQDNSNKSVDTQSLFSVLENPPIISPHYFKRSDRTMYLYKNSMFTSMNNLYKIVVNIKTSKDTGERIIEEVREPLQISDNNRGTDGTIFLQNVTDLDKLYYKNIKLFTKNINDVSGKTVSIMSMGDSLTEGNGTWDTTPICLLTNQLNDAGVIVTYVGSLARTLTNSKTNQNVKINYEGRGGYRYRSMVGLEGSFAGINMIIPSNQTKSEWVVGVDGSDMTSIKANNTWLYPATNDDKLNYPDWCFNFVSGSLTKSVSYSENSTLTDYWIFDPIRYFELRGISKPDILTMAFGTNEWYLPAYGGFNLELISKCVTFMLTRLRQALPSTKIIIVPANNMPTTRQNFWELYAAKMASNVIKVCENLNDNLLYICPIYLHGARWLSYNATSGSTEDITTDNTMKKITIDSNVHVLNTLDDSSYDYIDSLTACVVNMID